MYVNWTFRALWGANQAAALINVSLSPTSNLLATTTTIRVFYLEYLVSVWYVLAELLAKIICYQEQTKLKLSEFLLLATFLYRYIRNILCNSETLSLKKFIPILLADFCAAASLQLPTLYRSSSLVLVRAHWNKFVQQ